MSDTTAFEGTKQVSLRELFGLAFATVRAANAKRAERARVRFELNQYSDRELADMGLSRSDIPGIAARA